MNGGYSRAVWLDAVRSAATRPLVRVRVCRWGGENATTASTENTGLDTATLPDDRTLAIGGRLRGRGCGGGVAAAVPVTNEEGSAKSQPQHVRVKKISGARI